MPCICPCAFLPNALVDALRRYANGCPGMQMYAKASNVYVGPSNVCECIQMRAIVCPSMRNHTEIFAIAEYVSPGLWLD